MLLILPFCAWMMVWILVYERFDDFQCWYIRYLVSYVVSLP